MRCDAHDLPTPCKQCRRNEILLSGAADKEKPMTNTVTIEVKIKPPVVPNFVVMDDPATRKSLDSAHDEGLSIDVGQLDEAGVQLVIDLWTLAFRNNVLARKAALK